LPHTRKGCREFPLTGVQDLVALSEGEAVEYKDAKPFV
jgi:hypothetical protein